MWKFFPRLVAVAAVVLASFHPATAAEAASKTLVFVHAAVVDAATDNVRADQTVIVVGDRILAVGPSSIVVVPDRAKVVDATGKFLIPGLWDAHVHTRYAGIDHLRLMLANGITSARDMGGPWSHLPVILQWRSDIDAGKLDGPYVWTPGSILNGPGSPWSHITVVRTADEARKAVDLLKREGADFVKTYSDLSDETYSAIVAETNNQGMTFAGHIPRALGPIAAADAGERSIEHITDLLPYVSDYADDFASGKRPFAFEDLKGTMNADRVADVIAHFKADGTIYTPTLVLAWLSEQVARGNPAVTQAAYLRYVPPAYVEQWRKDIGRRNPAQRRILNDEGLKLTGLLNDAGIPLMAGTDTIKPFLVPGFALHDELDLLVEAGLSNRQALEAATVVPARFFGLNDQGFVEPGFKADLVLLDANPLKDIDATRRIRAVVAAGRYYDRATLDDMLDDIARSAAEWQGTPTGR